MLRCCVIDDEPLAANLIGSYASRTPSLQLAGVFNSARDAYSLIASGQVDLIFLDIHMPEISGMEFVKVIPPQTMVVFVTAYDSYAIEGLRANAVDYLLKPVDYKEFLAAVNRAMERRASLGRTAAESAPATPYGSEPESSADDDYIIVKSEYRLRQILKSSILYVEGLKDYVRIFLEGEQKSVMTLLSMQTLEQSLPRTGFMRVHRSYIVNLNRITTIERNRITLTDHKTTPPATHEIPVSDSYRSALQAYVATRFPGESPA